LFTGVNFERRCAGSFCGCNHASIARLCTSCGKSYFCRSRGAETHF
jgi:hypothetical protein